MIAIFILYTCTIFAPLNLGINRYSLEFGNLITRFQQRRRVWCLPKEKVQCFFSLLKKDFTLIDVYMNTELK